MDGYITSFLNYFLALFVMVDPFAAIPISILLMQRLTPVELVHALRKSFFVATGILIGFAIGGVTILKFFEISVAALRIAGGFLLLKFTLEHMAVEQPEPQEGDIAKPHKQEDLSIVPLAIPMLAGPGAISLLVVEASYTDNHMERMILLVAVLAVMFISYFILKFSQHIFKILGETGLKVFTKIMVLLIAAIAIQYILSGLMDAFPALKPH